MQRQGAAFLRLSRALVAQYRRAELILNGSSAADEFESPLPLIPGAAKFYEVRDPYPDTTLTGPLNQYTIIDVAPEGSSFTNPRDAHGRP